MATVYISPTGQGSANGTSESNAYAYSSKTSAEGDAGSGGTILFLDGDYPQGANQTWGSEGVTYKSLNRFGANIIGTTSVRVLNIGSLGNGVAVTVSGFSFQDFVFKFTPPGSNTSVVQTLEFCKATQTMSSSSAPIAGQSGANDRAMVNFCALNFRPSGNSFGTSASNYIYKNSSFFFDLTDATEIEADSNIISNNCIYSSNNNLKWTAPLATLGTNCCFHNMGSGNTSGGTNNIFVDPVFVDPGTDLRLRPTSPCINSGIIS